MNSSSRPSIMAAERIHLAESGSGAKDPAGPMMGPSPGPTLASAVPAAETAVRHNILEFAELFLFLLVAMTYIDAMDERPW